MKRYPSYKDSGIDWLGEIPEHWVVKELKYLSVNERYSFVDGPFGSDLKNEEYTDTGVPLIQLNNIGIGEHIIRNLKFISKEKAEQLYKHKVLPNDIVIAKMAEPVARSAKVKPDFKEYVVVADCMKFRPALDTINVDFLVYTMNVGYVKAQAEVRSTGTTRIRIGLTNAKKLKVVVPPLPEQQTIANYLDHKTHLIDTLIDKKEKRIDLLKEQRAAIINQAVTKGLNPNVKLKDS
ncbi:MAG: restriction endonuclease subunit S, partial [Proteobacteria bacterium]|nr:restriction endonuclease subunit S [Pseudomonadota bacterium]